MATELLRVGDGNTLGFGDYTLNKKTKVEDFEFQGDVYKVKTFSEITKLEKNGMFVYESVPGTAVSKFHMLDAGISFDVCGNKDVQVTVELEPKQNYMVSLNENEMGVMTSNISGKLSICIELSEAITATVKIMKE